MKSKSFRILLALALALFFVTGAFAAAKTWNGGGADNNWNTANNWGGTAPVSLDSLVFDGSTRVNNTNNIAASTQFNGITYNSTAGTFTNSGNALNLGGDITDNSTNTETINLALAMTANRNFSVTSGGSLAIGGVISGAFALTETGSGTLTLSGANTFTGVLTNQAGTLSIATINNASANGTLGNSANAVVLGGSGTTGTLDYSGATASSSKTFTMATSGTGLFQIDSSAATLTLSGVIGGSGGLTLIGSGTLDLTGANTYTGTTTVNGGTLLVDRSIGASISSSSALNLGGGTLSVKFDTSGNDTQTFASTTINAGDSSVTTSGGKGNKQDAVAFGGITRNAGATVDFAMGGNNIVPKTTSGNDSGGILGAYATYLETDWASVSGGIIGAATYTQLPASGGSSTVNYDNHTTASVTLTANESVNTLKLNTTTTGQSLNLGGKTLTLSDDGLLFVGANNFFITNGTLTASNGVGGYELIVQQYGAGNLTNVANITDNGANSVSLTESGTGTLVFATNNTYSGNTLINAGTLDVKAANGIAGSNVTVVSGATLTLENSSSITNTAYLLFSGASPVVNLSFSGTNTIAALSFDGGVTYQAVGTWGHSNVTYTNAIFTGSGALKVVSATTTALTTSTNSAVYGSSVVFTATVAANPAGTGTPTGTVTFKDGATTLGTGTLNGSGVATYTNSSLSVAGSSHSITAVYGADNNFNASTSSAVSQAITAKAITVSNVSANNKVYDQTTAATITTNGWAFTGVINSDVVTLLTNGTAATFTPDAGVANGKTVTYSGLSLGGSKATNYSLTPPTLTANITAKSLTVSSGITANNKTYDQTTTATINTNGNVQFSGVIGGDSVKLAATNGYTATFTPDAGVANNKTVTVSGLALGGNQGTNYSLTQPSLTANITALGVTVSSGVTANNKVYDGTTTATINTNGNVQFTGKIGGDTLTLVTNGYTATFASANVGTSIAVTVSGTSLGGNQATNYSLTAQPSGLTANITQASTAVTISSSHQTNGYLSSVTFTASSLPTAATGNVIFKTNSTALSTNAVSSGSATSAATTSLPRGTNTISAEYAGDANYTGSTNSLNQVVTNHPPVAGTANYTRPANVSLKFPISDLLTNVTDADSDTITLTSVSSGTAGVTVKTNSTQVLYASTNNAGDSFSYTVNDGHGGSATGTVAITVAGQNTGQNATISVTNLTVTLTFFGTPGLSYITQRSTNMFSTSVNIHTDTAPAGVMFQVIDTNAPTGSAYYRLSTP